MLNLSNKYTIPIDELMVASIADYKNKKVFTYEKLKKIPIWKKVSNERQLKKVINNLFIELKPFLPELKEYSESPSMAAPSSIQEIKRLLIKSLKEIDKKKLLFDHPFLYYFINQGYMNIAEEFLLRARQEDSNLNNEEIFQALRNVWIMNSLQLYWDIPLHLTTPMYAYSMLYPYTDNLLDDPNITDSIKHDFNNRLGKVLKGEAILSSQMTEKRIFSFVDEIRNYYPNEINLKVMESIQLIHNAQIESLLQGKERSLSEKDILAISFFKGGTSVLADAYLIKGKLSINEMNFAFQYGTFLQLLDDLQDKEEDTTNNNQTLFTNKQTPETTEKEVYRLISYINHVNEKSESDSQNTMLMKDVISQCTLLMIMEAIGKNPNLITHSMYKELESYSKVRLTFYKEMEKKMKEFINQ